MGVNMYSYYEKIEGFDCMFEPLDWFIVWGKKYYQLEEVVTGIGLYPITIYVDESKTVVPENTIVFEILKDLTTVGQ